MLSPKNRSYRRSPSARCLERNEKNVAASGSIYEAVYLRDKIASRLLSHDFKGERWLSAWASGATLLAGPQCDIRSFEYRGIAGGIGMRPSGKIAGRGALLRVTFNTRRGGGGRGGFHVGRFEQILSMRCVKFRCVMFVVRSLATIGDRTRRGSRETMIEQNTRARARARGRALQSSASAR